MQVVLLQPEIPPNTGNVARLCAATNSPLHLIEPLGFRLDDRELKRAGLDYWKQVRWQRWSSWNEFEAQLLPGAGLWLIECNGRRPYAQAEYQPGDYLVFGRETAGLPAALLARFPERGLHVPMFNPLARSLNVANCVALVLYEALRQHGFPGALPASSPLPTNRLAR